MKLKDSNNQRYTLIDLNDLNRIEEVEHLIDEQRCVILFF